MWGNGGRVPEWSRCCIGNVTGTSRELYEGNIEGSSEAGIVAERGVPKA
jgi:hypothetical protein